MAIHIKNINGHDYAYEVKSVWDKERKKVKKQESSPISVGKAVL